MFRVENTVRTDTGHQTLIQGHRTVRQTRVDCVWNVIAHAQKPDFVFRRNGRVHLNRRRCQFSRLLAAEVCASAIVRLDTPRSEVEWTVLATHSIRPFPLHFLSNASQGAITFQLDSTRNANKAADRTKHTFPKRPACNGAKQHNSILHKISLSTQPSFNVAVTKPTGHPSDTDVGWYYWESNQVQASL